VGCLLNSRAQVSYWQNSTTLFEHALQVTPDNYVAHNSLGMALFDSGKLDDAEMHFVEALRLKPASDTAQAHLGAVLLAKGKTEEAAAHLQKALRNNPQMPDACNNLGQVYMLQHKPDAAIAMFVQALKLDPHSQPAHHNLGFAYAATAQWEECATELNIAVLQIPADFQAQTRLIGALLKLGRQQEALAHCQSLTQAWPNHPQPRFLLAEVCLAQNQPEAAVANLDDAIRLAPNSPLYLNQLAWILATHPLVAVRSGARAARLAERACELTQCHEARLLLTLSAAYAEAGRFEQATRTAEEARAVATTPVDAEAAARYLDLYQAGKPLREP
jgi:tetratricopeptide (TPR) repeat protein